jgi:TfoX/Sxy family transcriptional regulator of competence genes
MAWEKSPPALVALFDASVPDDPRVERRQMFGYPAAFAGGHLFMSLFQQDFVLRLAAADCAAFTARFGERPFAPMEGRVMRGYVRLPPALTADEGERAEWVARALANALALPAKPRKAPKAPAG